MSPMAQEVSFAAGVMYLESLQTEEMWVWILPQSLSNLLTLKKWINISSLRFYSYQVKIKPIYLVGLLWEKKKNEKSMQSIFPVPRSIYSVCVSCSVMSAYLWPHGLPIGLLCPWNSPGKNTGVDFIPHPRDLPNPGIEPRSPVLQADSLLSEPPM